MVVALRLLFLSPTTKSPSLTIDGMAPLVGVPYVPFGWWSPPHRPLMYEVSPPQFDLQPLVPATLLFQESIMCQHPSNYVLH